MPRVAIPEPLTAGTVRFLLADGSRAMVALEDGRTVSVVREQVCPLVPLDRVLNVGMVVEGALDPSGKELRPAFEPPSPAVLDAVFPDGVVTSALVTRAGQLGGELALHPSVRIPISRMDVSSNPKDRLDDLLEVGEVVSARVLHNADGSIRLRLIDVDDDEPVQPALRLLPDGPEWLALPDGPSSEVERDQAEDDEAPSVAVAPAGMHTVPSPSARTALQSAQLALEAERAETARLRRELDAARATSPAEMREVRADLGRALGEHRQLGEQLRAANREIVRVRKVQRVAAGGSRRRARRERFADDEPWIRHELYLTWIDRVEPAERTLYGLPADYVVGDDFAESLEQLDEDRLEKAFRACVDVLTGRADTLASRGVHPLRTNASGGAPDLGRADGARCMRCAIENDTASARRLHWWRLRNGGIELSRVVLHDDMTP
jgi:hypothetical protein